MPNSDVFISYKSEDYAEAMWVKQVLELNKIQCWIAPDCIYGGSNYAQAIPQAIAECKVFLLLLTNKTQQSVWVSKELNMAINAQKTIMPFVIEECELYNEFNFYLSDVQRYDAYKNKANAIRKLVLEVWMLLGIDRTVPEIIFQTDPVTTVPKVDAEPAKVDPKPVKTDAEPAKSPVSQNKGMFFRWLLPTYVISIPAGLIITLIALIRNLRHFDRVRTNQLVKIWSIIGMPIGFIFYLMGVTNLDENIHILYTSILGLITLIAFG